MLPAIPTWGALHPLIIHFPIALLLVVPVFVVMSMLLRNHQVTFAIAALILMVLGTIGIIAAVSSGEAAGERAEDHPSVEVTLERHEDLAENAQAMFIILTLIYATLCAALSFPKYRLDGWPRRIVHAAFLIVYVAGCATLIRTGHEGGRLVHQFGVHAQSAPSPTASIAYHHDDEDDRHGHDED